jgi:hypothetical protein
MRGRSKKSEVTISGDDESLMQQRSVMELDSYIQRITSTVRSAVCAPRHDRTESRSPPGPFRKQCSPTLQRKKSSDASGALASSSGADTNSGELLRLQKENAELLFLIAAGERSLATKQTSTNTTSPSQSLIAFPAAAGGMAAMPSWLQRFQTIPTMPSPADGLLRGMSAAAMFGEQQGSQYSSLALDEHKAITVVANTLTEARNHAAGAPPPRSIIADLETDIDVRSRAAAPHRRSNEAALKRLTDYVFAPYFDFEARRERFNVAATQTDSIVDLGDLHYTFSPRLISGTSGISIDLRSALQRDELTRPMILAASLPFPTMAAAAPSSAPAPSLPLHVSSPVPNRVLLERLLQYHKTGVVETGEGEGSEAAHASSRAGPGAIQLLERFMKTERRPADFREGIAARFLHQDDPLLCAYPCVYLPTIPLMPHDEERNRFHAAWIFICRCSMFLLVDASDTPEQLEQDVIDSAAPENWGFRSPPKTADEIKRKAVKRGKKRQELHEESMAQLKNCTLLLQVAEWDSTLVRVDYSQGSPAFAQRTLNDEQPVLLDFGSTPRIDALMALYNAAGVRVEPAELGRQLYASMVLHCHRSPQGKKIETVRYSVVFLSETDRNELTSYLWAALHPGRVSGDVFCPARRPNEAMLPVCLNMGALNDRSMSSKEASIVHGRIRGLDPMTLLEASQRPSALLDPSPFLRYSEPVTRSTHVDWYPMHAVLTAFELEFCRNAHVHPVTLHTIKKDLIGHPFSTPWITFGDVATVLMSHTNAEHPCLATTERVLQLLCGDTEEVSGMRRANHNSGAVCEAIEIIQRLP